MPSVLRDTNSRRLIYSVQQHSELKDEDLEVLHIVDVCMCV